MAVEEFLNRNCETISNGQIDFCGNTFLHQNLRSITVSDVPQLQCNNENDNPIDDAYSENGVLPWELKKDRGCLPLWEAEIHMFTYQPSEEGPSEEATEGSENTTVFTQWSLPAVEFEGLWESLIFESNIQSYLLNYVSTSLLFAEKNVDSNIISWNNVVLLHGPPGTGKTSLCKALAQKLSIRLDRAYRETTLLEINSHSLFSKWFSESGKLVSKLFQYIYEITEDQDTLVCILIDEVESLAAARSAAASGSEPSDSIRVVNALLTQIDMLKSRRNVVILTTSNITQSIDVAFVDRADIRQYIGLPTKQIRFHILRSCIEELERVGLIKATTKAKQEDQELIVYKQLWESITECEGLSGRALRKLPFQAFAKLNGENVSPFQFIQALREKIIELRDEQIASNN
uniref:AAA+ ATPase domain-containing protein n=1 Tax=Aplanochytrium stocchinoi TaxID=215587 RepID=A0A6S8A3B0_9STRA